MNAAVIVAAGRGTRMGLERNKVLAPLCGEPSLRTGWRRPGAKFSFCFCPKTRTRNGTS